MKLEKLKKDRRKDIIIGVLVVLLLVTGVLGFVGTMSKYRYTSSAEIVNGTVHFNTGDLSILAVNLATSSGSWNSSDKVPTSGYTLNTTESYCGISNGDGTYTHDTSVTMSYHDGVMSFDNITQKGTKCFLYFDLDSAPTINAFYIGGSSNPSTITSTSTTVYITFSDTDVAYYCISTTNSSSSCSWKSASSSPISASYTISGSGTVTLYAFLKDKGGNISSSKSDSIIVGTNLKDAILANNTKDTSRSSGSFTGVYTTSTAGKIFTGTDDYGTTYFFAGASPNNWVKFAGFYWRIIRINGDGSIRLIYNGTDTSTTGTTTQLSSTSGFNSSYNDNAYVGYMYGTTGASTYAKTHTNTNSSTIKGVLDTWYTNNLKSYASYIDTNAGFCGDRTSTTSSSSAPSSSNSGGYGTTETFYGALYRNYTTSTPSFKCSQTNDLYTVSSSSYGNKALTYPIGLITADEVSYAGAYRTTANSSYWLYTNQYYWLMSPYSLVGDEARVFFVGSDGSLNGIGAYLPWGVRPVINLKSTTTVTGSGMSSDPYIVS